jgi:hypothetical protein
MFTILDISCPFLPDDVDVRVISSFRTWLSQDPKEYNFPFHNGLKLFLWLVNDCFNLAEDAAVLP